MCLCVYMSMYVFVNIMFMCATSVGNTVQATSRHSDHRAPSGRRIAGLRDAA